LDGRQYKGDFSDHKYHGWGTFVEINGETYQGDFKKGIKQGVGIYSYLDGSRYEGLFDNGKRHGKGTLTATKNTTRDFDKTGEGFTIKLENSKKDVDYVYKGDWFGDKK
jgi:hypothetical protein